MMVHRHLYAWVDFQSFQVFEEAITYTALQFYSKAPNERVAVAFAPDGTLDKNSWARSDASLPYGMLPFGDRWLMTTGADCPTSSTRKACGWTIRD